MGKNQTTSLINNKNELRNLYERCGNKNMKRKCPIIEEIDVNHIAHNSFCKELIKNLPMFESIIKYAALEVA